MPLYNWTPSCSVGVMQFDKQHQHLFILINDLNSAMQAGQGRVVLGSIIMALSAYAKDHFTAEEAAMRRTSYPKLAEHYQEHQAFTTRVSEFLAEFEAGKMLISIDVLSFLSNWLKNHIMHSDQAYAAHLNKKGIH